jgi:hypothetical protein
VPSISYHKFKVVIIINWCANIFIILLEFLIRYCSILLQSIPLCHELLYDLVLWHLSTLEFRMEWYIKLIN